MKSALVNGTLLRKIVDIKPTIRKNIFSTSSDEYQYIHKSTVPTLHFQPGLPQLPIPSLNRTCQRYLAAQKPLLTHEQFTNTQNIVREFQEIEGKALHEDLVALNRQNKHTSYVANAWLEMYLKTRDPVTTINGFMMIIDDPKTEYNNQLIRASNIVISTLRYMCALRDNFLEPVVKHTTPVKSDTRTFRQIMRYTPSQLSYQSAVHIFKAEPLDMSQYQWLFSGARVPHRGQDDLTLDKKATHVMALRNGNVYVFDVLDEKGYIKDPSYIHGCLQQVLADSRPKAEFPVAAITTLNRDSAADLRQQLIDAGNTEVLRLIDVAIFSICLDDEVVENNPLLLADTMYYGDGSNRWFDKTLEMVIKKDGKAGIHNDHSRIDGLTTTHFVKEMARDTTNHPFIHPNSQPVNISSSVVQCLEFTYTPRIREEIHNALEKHRIRVSCHRFNVFCYDKFGKVFMKKQKLSLDAILQLSFQMSYFRLTGKTVASYESCSTAAFRHGRTETIRPASVATKRCSEAFSRKDTPFEELRLLIAASSKNHQVLAREATSGNGFDRHLFMLRILAEAAGNQKLSTIFADPAYKAINHNIISTSSLSMDLIPLIWFSPVVADGFGIAYSVNEESLRGVISNHPKHSDGDGFLECLLSSLDDIFKVLLKTSA